MVRPDLESFRQLASRARAVPLVREVVADLDTALAIFLKVDDRRHAFLFESNEGGEKWGRYSFIGLGARAIFEARAGVVEISRGGELYRLNCSSCHNFTGQGGALSQGKSAPALTEATDRQIWGAMLSGPQNMPKFGDGQLTTEEKQAIVSFIQNNKATIDPGGYSAGGFGPAPEGLIAFLVGMGAIVAATLWMGSRA